MKENCCRVLAPTSDFPTGLTDLITQIPLAGSEHVAKMCVRVGILRLLVSHLYLFPPYNYSFS